jgi:serine/threonine protein kinase
MTPERWKKLDVLFHEALALQGEARAAHLAKACGGDEQLRAEVERLLAAHERESSFLDLPISEQMTEPTDSEHQNSLAGHSLGPYQVRHQLGRGGMGEVYLAEDRRLHRKVALKVLPAAFTKDADRVRRFEREARAASALNHPNILTIYEIGQAEGRHFIATEFVEGVTLRQQMESGRLSLAETLSVAAQVASALSAAHQAGIIHRDIKPENVMLRPDGLVKVLDFGLAKLTERPAAMPDAEVGSQAPTAAQPSTEPGVAMGTVQYMSPEQARGLKVDQRTDIFSLGVMLYEMLARCRPFEGATMSDVIAALLTSNPLPLSQARPDAPPELERTVSRCLEKDRAARYQSAAELHAEFERLQRKAADEALATEEATAVLKRSQRLKTAEAPLNQTPERSRWRRWRIVVCVTAALLLVALVISWRLWRSDYFWQNPLADARAERLTDFEGDEVDAAISPDGRLMVFLSDRDGRFDAWVSQIGSGEFVNITKGRFPTLIPSELRTVGVSGDGAQVWFGEGDSPKPKAVWLASGLGSAPRLFLAPGMEPAWSPDGNQIVYHTNDPGDPIFMADRSGSNPKGIFVEKPDGHCHYLTWSPDGRFIYFVKGSPTTEEMDIW